MKFHSCLHCLGVWCKELIKEGSKFGPFVGEKAYEVDESMDPAYIWEVSIVKLMFYCRNFNVVFSALNCISFI